MRRLEQIARARRRFAWALGERSGALILLYHRIGEPGPDPWRLAVSPSHFAQHLEVLRRQAAPMPLARLVSALSDRRRLPRRAVAVTFDDGYADNLHAARPLLARYDVPATVFLATGAIGSRTEFWWDGLEQVVLQQPQLPEVLRLTLDGQAHLVPVAGPASERGEAYETLWRLLWPLPADRRRAALDDLWGQAGARPHLRVSHRTLSEPEVAELAVDDLVMMGAHTVSHPVLPWLPPAEQRAEIELSKAACEVLSGRPAAGFSYPHGETSDATAAIVRAAGFPCACTGAADVASRRCNLFMLPRVAVEDWDGGTFARRLARAFLA